MSIFKAYDIRGIYGTELTEDIAEKIGRALTVFLDTKKIVIGYDMRPHSKPLFDAMSHGITDQGVDVIDLGMCSTPMTYFGNGFLGADASVIITASHNPAEYNGMKLCREQAIPISGATGIKDIEKLVLENNFPASDKKGTVEKHDISEEYKKHLRSFIKFSKKPKIVVDYANSMGLKEIEGLTDLFDITPMYDEYDGTFPNHEANPLKLDTLDAIRAKVLEVGADFGVAYDGDADRSGFIDDNGEIIPMDMTTAIIAQDILQSGPATILYDLRSSWAVRECIEDAGGKAIMSRVGHAFIKAQMRENDAVFAGELSGHYYFKENYTAESQGLALIMIANVLEKSGKKLSEIVAPLKKYFSSGEVNSEVEDKEGVIAELKKNYADGKLFELDGVSVEFDDWWFNVRPSNTEPYLRLIVEAKTKQKMEEKLSELLSYIRK
ncbi:MAG: phosphomannomutase/phosphoglucomutase [Verrucomicrobiota bacterium]|nr:phosphomannomutase/phosphoglucomutase [Verrucomicrobiota bacterium]